MKKILETILGLACVFCIVLAGGEKSDGSCDVWWTISWLFLAGVLGIAWGRLFNTKPVHVTTEAYEDLQAQIQIAAETMDEDEHKTVEIDAELPNDAAIYLTLEITTSSSRLKFTDDAWGATQTFTELCWRCECEITDVKVLDKRGKIVESDFDETELELEYETTEWR